MATPTRDQLRINLLDGPDANLYEIAAFVAMMLSILVSAVTLYGIGYAWHAHNGSPGTAIYIATPLLLLSTAGLAIGFARNRARDIKTVTQTLLCAAFLPVWTIFYAPHFNFVVFGLIAPGLLLSVLSTVKLIQLRPALRQTPWPQ